MTSKEEVFVSVDVEADGPIPGPNSMLSMGAAAFGSDGKLLSTYSANLKELPGASPDAETQHWWLQNKEAYEATRKDAMEPKEAIARFVIWVKGLPGTPVFVGYPAGFDFTFIYWYIRYFKFESPFSFSALDIKSYASAILGTPYRESVKKNMPRRWFAQGKRHTHVALDDAIEQGELFMNMRRENLSSKKNGASEEK